MSSAARPFGEQTNHPAVWVESGRANRLVIISSRTPEGEPNYCPICRADVRIEPSLVFGDATCPNCGSLLWFLKLPGERIVFDRDSSRPISERVIDVLAAHLNVDREQIAVSGDTVHLVGAELAGADSLDLAELLMVLEEEFELPEA